MNNSATYNTNNFDWTNYVGSVLEVTKGSGDVKKGVNYKIRSVVYTDDSVYLELLRVGYDRRGKTHVCLSTVSNPGNLKYKLSDGFKNVHVYRVYTGAL
jgi:hypothetical protein